MFLLDIDFYIYYYICKLSRKVFIMARTSLKSQILTKIKRSRKNVFILKDFEKLSGYEQVGRALGSLTKSGLLIKIGYGLYAKAEENPLTGKPMFTADGGFLEVSEEALNRLKVKWKREESFLPENNPSYQVPANPGVVILDRFSRKIKTDKFELRVVK